MISRKVWVLWLFAGLMCLAVISGGCGGSSDSSLGSDGRTALSGVWHYESGTVSFIQSRNTFPANVEDFSIMYASCDVDGDNGSAVILAAAVLTSQNMLLPFLIDSQTVTSARTDYDAWSFTLPDNAGSYTARIEDGKLLMSGTFAIQTGVEVSFDITSTKTTSSQYGRVSNPSAALDGTWATDTTGTTNNGGGFMFGEGSYYIGTNAISVLSFSDTAAAMTGTKVTGAGFMNTVTAAGGNGALVPLTFISQDVALTHLFENYYKFTVSNVIGNMIGLFVFTSETSANMIVQGMAGIGEIHTLFMLSKKTDADNSLAIMGSLIPSSWDLKGGGIAINPNAATNSVVPLAGTGIDVSLISADTALNINLSFSGDIVVPVTGDVAMHFDGSSIRMPFKQVGYHMYYAQGGENPNHNLLFYSENENIAYITDTVTGTDGYYATIAGQLTKK